MKVMRLEEGLKSSSLLAVTNPKTTKNKKTSPIKEGFQVNPIDLFSNQILVFLENLVEKMP